MRYALLPLLFICILCWVIGCTVKPDGNAPEPAVVNQPAPAPEPEAEPQPEAPPSLHGDFGNWLEASPLRSDMRSMWVSAGLIVANAAGRYDTDYDSLESNARNIERKAGAYAAMWQTVRDENRAAATSAREREWATARVHTQRLWTACTTCHVETWPLGSRGILQESVDSWLQNDTAAERVPYGGLKLSSPEELLHVMYQMIGMLDRTVAGIEREDEPAVMRNTQGIDRLVVVQLDHWRAVEREARLIAETAARNDTLNIDLRYARMIRACNDCHEQFVKDDRAPLNPLPWKYRTD